MMNDEHPHLFCLAKVTHFYVVPTNSILWILILYIKLYKAKLDLNKHPGWEKTLKDPSWLLFHIKCPNICSASWPLMSRSLCFACTAWKSYHCSPSVHRVMYRAADIFRSPCLHLSDEQKTMPTCPTAKGTPTYPCGWRTANHFLHPSEVYPQLCYLHCTLLGVWVQPGVEEVEVEDLGEEGPCKVLEEVKVGVGSLGLHAKLHYVVLVVVHPEENQRLSVLMGCVGPKKEVESQSWLTVKERGLC